MNWPRGFISSSLPPILCCPNSPGSLTPFFHPVPWLPLLSWLLLIGSWVWIHFLCFDFSTSHPRTWPDLVSVHLHTICSMTRGKGIQDLTSHWVLVGPTRRGDPFLNSHLEKGPSRRLWREKFSETRKPEDAGRALPSPIQLEELDV